MDPDEDDDYGLSGSFEAPTKEDCFDLMWGEDEDE